MDVETLRERAPRIGAGLLLTTGILVVVVSLSLLVVPLPRYLGYPLPSSYRIILAGLGMLGGGMHLLAGYWAQQQQDFFKTTFAALVGMVFVQATIPVDLVAIGFLVLGRTAFEE